MLKITPPKDTPSNFHSYFRFVEQDEWNKYWQLKLSKKWDIRSPMQLERTPLGDFIEVLNGSATQHVCTDHPALDEQLQLAAELVRVEYFLKHNDLNSLIEEFESSDSAIFQVMTRKPLSERFISHDAYENARDLARVVSTRKAAVAALE